MADLLGQDMLVMDMIENILAYDIEGLVVSQKRVVKGNKVVAFRFQPHAPCPDIAIHDCVFQ
jgi:hypothetical protein